jgi:hypothetical protein
MEEFLKKAKKTLNLEHDSALADLIDVNREYYRKIKKAEITCNEAVLVRLAKKTNTEPAKLFIIANYTTTNENMKKHWQNMFSNYEKFIKKKGKKGGKKQAESVLN